VKSGQDHTLNIIKKVHPLAKNGTFANVNVAFIQYLLSNYEKNLQVAEKYKDEYLSQLEKNFPDNPRISNHIAGLLVAWRFFRKFALKNKVITKEESLALGKRVRTTLIKLMRDQEEIISINPGSVLIQALKRAFIEGKAHLKDSETGKQPEGFKPSVVGWRNNEPNGTCLGVIDSKTRDIFINRKIPVSEIISLIPEHDRYLFSDKSSKFWIDLKNQGLLNCSENKRNTTRQVFPGAKRETHYHCKIQFLDNPKSSEAKNNQTNSVSEKKLSNQKKSNSVTKRK